MPHALDLMQRDPLIVSPDLPLPRLARLLLETRADGACVVEEGRLVGVVTAMDLIFQDKRITMPHYLRLLGWVLPVGKRGQQAALDKQAGVVVRDIMSDDPLGVAWDAELQDIATLMVDEHITVVPVLQEGRLVGVITKGDLLRSALERVGEQEGQVPS
ncbi:CBS domain-containing protein [Myxococcota bacterium]|nr:CBS domain-containing protein [Myxococcota bacterium]